MGGVIGDYVHYRNYFYKKYGTTLDGPSDYSQATSVFNQYRTKLLNQIKATQTAKSFGDLQTFLNALLYGTKEKDPEIFINEAWMQYQESLNQILDKLYPQFGFNYKQGINPYNNLKNFSSKRKIISKEEINKYLTRITQMLNGSIGLKKDSNIEDLRMVQQQLINFLNTNQDTENFKVNFSNVNEIINNINRVLAYQSMPTELAKGDALEYFLSTASLFSEQKALEVGDKLVEEIQKRVVGTTGKSNIEISQDKFSSNVDLSQILTKNNNWIKMDENNSYRMSLASQDKLDVEFLYQGQDFAVSAKNYSLRSEDQTIHILSGSTLLYLIHNEDPYMVNHWLNLISLTNNKPDTSNDSSLLQLAHETMKINLLIKALTGSGLGRGGSADTFILNNRSKKELLILSMESVANKAIRHLGELDFKGYPNSLQQNYEGDRFDKSFAQIRITNLLKSVYNCKISVALSQSVFY